MFQVRATQLEVARRANVSQTTVSLILGNSTTQAFPGETLERVLKAARDLGYVPNRLAQALKTHRTMTLACVVPDIGNPFYPDLVRGVQLAAEDEGYDVIALNTQSDANRERRVLQWGLEGRVDGIIGVFFTLRARDFEPLTRAGVGILRIETSAKKGGNMPIDDLFVDNVAAATAATRYLLERGHTRITMITGAGGPQDNRVLGYRRTMTEAGLVPDILVHSGFDEDGGIRATQEVLSRPERPTAIFAANDLMAIGAISVLRDAGLRIPDDIAVMGFDDIFAARVLTPALSTVNQFQNVLGQVAAHMMLQRITELGQDAPSRHREMPFEVVPRQSA
ncbi:LacI family DNA-binding transcriptional regulator [Caballeronia mineralivorans]|jgi:LacI family transcriptional regulator|uniref:LacI family DNA-binding transcriptional regulator n=1 Tax=Caballeronia mineralivorans TaxID=2010198 RepID=UPI0023F4C842|nr:LacI family DNA-binding transcriptional regulator [Caballeronia mineralivorans]MDB5789202.1 LacI family transcriptional regulator [Caballeronia mineralivorans]MEA3096880.1 LacI family transcriptional regulator [Caballeronia mineralivorans]